MDAKSRHRIMIPIIAILNLGILNAQPKSIGANYCFSGVSFSYEHSIDQEIFLDFTAKAELSELFQGREEYPGCSLSITCNSVIKEWESEGGERVRFLIGSGAAIGIGKDFKTDYGLFFGLKGRAGLEWIFDRGACISMNLSPILGQHVVRTEDAIRMKGYRNGLIFGLAPEIGIKYCF